MDGMSDLTERVGLTLQSMPYRSRKKVPFQQRARVQTALPTRPQQYIDNGLNFLTFEISNTILLVGEIS